MYFFVILLLMFLPSFVSCASADPQPTGLLLVADFDEGIQNRLGGYYNKFERSPSLASTFLVSDIHRGSGGRSLRLTTERKSEGFCGVWMHLFNFRSPGERRYFDAQDYEYLSFWIKGAKGGEDFTVKLADQEWIEQEDGLPVGPVGQFLKGGVTTQWQEVLVPLKKFNTLDFSKMGGVTLDFDSIGSWTVYIDDVAFKTSAQVSTPLTKAKQATGLTRRHFPRAMWIWSTNTLLDSATERETLFSFCQRQNVDQLWIQVLYRIEPGVDLTLVASEGLPEGVRGEIQRADDFRQFLAQAHKHGIEVHALDGYPEFAQKIYHRMPLAIVDAIIAFNKSSKQPERFDGIHFDNEPYLIAGSRDRDRNREILAEFLELNAECQKRVREQSDMVYGIDIPFFWQEADLKTGEVGGMVTFNGQSKPASFHCIDMLDNVGIMNYRDTADGADGMIAHGQELLAYGDKMGKAKIYMGIETFSYEPTECWFAVGLPREVFAKAIQGKGKALSRLSRINGFRKQIFDDGANIHVGIELPPTPTPQLRARAKKSMIRIAKQLGVLSVDELKDRVEELSFGAQDGFTYDVEWRNPREREIFDEATGAKYPGLLATSIMLPKITFAQESYDEINAQTGAAEAFFETFKSYSGIAIHYYKTYKAKVDAAKKPAS